MSLPIVSAEIRMGWLDSSVQKVSKRFPDISMERKVELFKSLVYKFSSSIYNSKPELGPVVEYKYFAELATPVEDLYRNKKKTGYWVIRFWNAGGTAAVPGGIKVSSQLPYKPTPFSWEIVSQIAEMEVGEDAPTAKSLATTAVRMGLLRC